MEEGRSHTELVSGVNYWIRFLGCCLQSHNKILIDSGFFDLVEPFLLKKLLKILFYNCIGINKGIIRVVAYIHFSYDLKFIKTKTMRGS